MPSSDQICFSSVSFLFDKIFFTRVCLNTTENILSSALKPLKSLKPLNSTLCKTAKAEKQRTDWIQIFHQIYDLSFPSKKCLY